MIASSLRAGTSLGRDESKRHSSILIKIEIKIWFTHRVGNFFEWNRGESMRSWYSLIWGRKLRRSWNFEFSFNYKITSFVPVNKLRWNILSKWKVISGILGLVDSKQFLNKESYSRDESSISTEYVIRLDHLLIEDILTNGLELCDVTIQGVSADGRHLLLNFQLHLIGHLKRWAHW